MNKFYKIFAAFLIYCKATIFVLLIRCLIGSYILFDLAVVCVLFQFAEETNYLEECFNGHLVQANSDNKQIMKKKLDEKTMRGGSIGIANFQTALTTAFQLLKNVSSHFNLT